MQRIRFVKDSEGHRVACAEIGSGPVLLCPAWWVSHVERDWEHPGFRAFFTSLAQDFRVVRYDLPGMGLSDRDVPQTTLHSEIALLERIADDLTAARLAILAISCAGPVAISYAARHPDRVGRMCFFGSFARGTDIATPEVRSAMIALLSAHWGMGSKMLADIFVPGASGEELELLSRNQRAWASNERATEMLERSYAADGYQLLPRIQCEALVMHREGDRAIPFEAGRRLAAGLPRARFVPLRGSIHPPWFGTDGPEELIRAFLATGTVSSTHVATDDSCVLDHSNREIVIGGSRRATTPLEWGVIQALTECRGRVVTRDELLRRVWKQPFAGSNKVEAVIRALRKKLGAYSVSIETVTGHGYRFRSWVREGTTDQ